ncbi:MAG: hypothetical protein MUD10_05115 [Candidatus Pacebacteria bacterium]|jgi:hypothetical protein|nr:hypothetical protein [Candidatus Paceibacterota bacterium]
MRSLKDLLFFKIIKAKDYALVSLEFGLVGPVLLTFVSVLMLFSLFLPVGLFVLLPLALFYFMLIGGWAFPVIGLASGIRGLKTNKKIAVTAIILSSCQLMVYVSLATVIFVSVIFGNNFID